MVVFGSVQGNRKNASMCSNVYYREEPAFGEKWEGDEIGPILVHEGEWSTLASRISPAFKDQMNIVEGLEERTPGLAWEEKITNED